MMPTNAFSLAVFYGCGDSLINTPTGAQWWYTQNHATKVANVSAGVPDDFVWSLQKDGWTVIYDAQ